MTFSSWTLPSWFGPDNYAECTFEKVKECGENKACARLAYEVCDKDFPLEEVGDWEFFDWQNSMDKNYRNDLVELKDGGFITKFCAYNNSVNFEECFVFENYKHPLEYSCCGYSPNAIIKGLYLFDPIKNLHGNTFKAFRKKIVRQKK